MLQLSLSQLFTSIGGWFMLSLIGLVIYLSKALITREKKTMDDKITSLENSINARSKKFQEELDAINDKINKIDNSIASILGLLTESTKKSEHKKRGYLAIVKTLKDIGGKDLIRDKEFMAELIKELSKRENED